MPVHLPLEKFERCFKCNKGEDLRLCSRCGEASYCSSGCQKADWKSHSESCGKNEMIDLSAFYPFLACLAELTHAFPEKPQHPALVHRIINDANPGVNPYELPDGLSPAKLLVLDNPRRDDYLMGSSGMDWFPQALSIKVLSKLANRVRREGYALQIAMAVCFALVYGVYTTTSSKEAVAEAKAGNKKSGGKKRVRFRYNSSPFADFGVCVGSAEVTSQDRLAYWLPDGELVEGQDPNEHYWIYFRTIKGEEITLDFAMFTFNMCLVIDTEDYFPRMASPFAPVFYRSREYRKNSPELGRERRRISILRNAVLKEIFDDPSYFVSGVPTPAALDKLVALAEQFSGSKFNDAEDQMLRLAAVRHSMFLCQNIANEEWRRFPTADKIKMAIEQDPGECDNLEKRAAAWWKTLQKYKRQHKKATKSTKTKRIEGNE